MRVVLQRVTRAEVRTGERVSGSIGPGLVLLAGFRADDDAPVLEWMADKILSLRLFPDQPGNAHDERAGRPSSFSRDVIEVGGGLLVVSQFTLYGDTRKGRRPSFTDAAPPEVAVPLYERFVAILEERAPGRVATGEFGAMMSVDLVNDGPVTLILDRPASP
ncbi:MAG: D-tyrosyl-tRNA(Tyr) deacylase [Gemmatimonadetes bacterium]|nr:D-tyrosyl-tRNA(Tyr) deacylase [Gemmatimonadota bacterium]